MKITLNNGTLNIAIAGDILSTNVQQLRPLLIAGIDQNPDTTSVVVDLASCKTIDSVGLNLLIALYRECEKRKLKFRIINPSDKITQLLTFLNLTERFGIQPNTTAS